MFSSIVVLLAGSLAALPGAAPEPQECPTPCPVEGCRGDPDLNRQKNRTGEPSAYRRLTFGEFVKLNEKAVNKKRRENWTDAEKKRIGDLENGQGVILTGLLLDAKLSVPEACNCFQEDQALRDFHIWLVRNKAHATKPESLVVEMTPPIRKDKSGWKKETLRKLIPPKAWSQVRVRGYLFFDSEHHDFPRREVPVRASAWEIHPVTEFEVCRQATCAVEGDAGWVKLEDVKIP